MTPTCVQSCKNLSKRAKLEAMQWGFFFFFFFLFNFYGCPEYYIGERAWHPPWGGTCPLQKKVELARGPAEATYKAGYTDGVFGHNSRCQPTSFWSPELTHAPATEEGRGGPSSTQASFKACSSSVSVGSSQVSYPKGHFAPRD